MTRLKRSWHVRNSVFELALSLIHFIATSVPGPDARKAEPAPTIGVAHDPLVPEAPVGAKKVRKTSLWLDSIY